MKPERPLAPLALRLLAAGLVLLGMAYVLMPMQALRPDGALAAHRDSVFLWVVFSLHPMLGIAMVVTGFLVWYRYTKRVLVCFWMLVAALGVGSPFTMLLLTHYGK